MAKSKKEQEREALAEERKKDKKTQQKKADAQATSQTPVVSDDRKGQNEESEKDQKAQRKEKRKRKKIQISENSIIHQIMPVVLVAVCAFLGICFYTTVPVGFLGEWLNEFFFGIIGCSAYFVPPMVLVFALLWQRDAKRHMLLKKLIFANLALLLIAVLFYTFGMPEESLESFSEFWNMGMYRIGGGFLGGMVGFALNFCFAKTGTIILSLLFLVVVAILFFDFRPNVMFMAIVRAARGALRARSENRKKEAEARAAEKEVQKRERRKQSEEDFYEKKTIPTFASSHKTENEPSAQMPFYPPVTAENGYKTQARSINRQFYDVDSDTAVFDPSQEIIPAAEAASVKPAAKKKSFDDEAFFAVDADDAIAESASTASYADLQEEPQKSENTLGERVIRADRLDSEGEEFTKIEVVCDRPIPQNNAVQTEKPADGIDLVDIPPIEDEPEDEVLLIDIFEEKEEAASDAALASGEVPNEEAEETVGEDGEKLIINKAHTIEHIGAEKFSDEAEEYYKKSDTFFYSFPPLSLLVEDTAVNQEDSDQEISDKAKRLIDTLESFGVQARISCVSRGPRLTRYELVPEVGVRIRSIENLVDEIAMNLEAVSVRIEAPIPGKAAIGVEVPNIKYSTVRLRGLLDTDKFRDAPGKTTVCLGVDVVGVPVFADLDKMPHLLVAGATGMGKSVCINSILVSLLYKARPDEVKLILIDPKKVEFKAYYNIPHLLVPVVTEPQKAAGALAWAVNEMERRYDIIERTGVRNIKAYNGTLAEHPEREKIPQIVIVIDELHDLMIQARDAVEDSIARIAAKARAAGILLIIGTQRPSVNVITGVIKANIPSRIAFHVASQVDSRTILDAVGAEKLLNDGDMLFLSPGMKMMTPKRVQGAFLDDDEVTRVADYLRKNSSGVRYDEGVMADMDRESEKYNKDKKVGGDMPMSEGGAEVGEDDLFYRAVEVALESGKVSTSLLQRKLSLGFGKAARMIDRMQEMGIVSEPNGQKPRDVLISLDEYRAMRLKNDQ